jgi:hypothetical protein
MVERSQRASPSGVGAFSMSGRSVCVFVSFSTRPVSLRICALSRSGVSPFWPAKKGTEKAAGLDALRLTALLRSGATNRLPDSRGAPPRRITVRDAAPRKARGRRWPGRLLEGSGANARVLSPFSGGRRIPAFAGTGRKRGWNSQIHLEPAPFHTSFSPLSRGEAPGGKRRALCREKTLPRAETVGPETPPWRGRDRVGR